MRISHKMENITPMIKKLLKTGFAHIFGATVINKIIGFFCGVLIVRFVTKAAFGEYTYAYNFISLFMLASGLGFSSGTFQLCSETKDDEEKQKLYKYGSAIGVRANLLMSVAIGIFAIVGTFKIPSATGMLLMMALLPFFNIILEFQHIYLRSNLMNKEYAYSCTINSVIIFVCSVAGSYFFKITGLIVGTYLSAILTIIIVYIVFGVGIGIRAGKLEKEVKKVLYKLSLISMCNNSLSQLLYLLDVFIIGIVVANPKVIASYKVATVIPTAISFIPSAVITYIYPYFALNKEDKDWSLTNYKILVKVMAAVNLIITAILFIGATPIIELIYGTDYADAVPCFRVLVVSYFFSGTFRIISGNLLLTQRKVEFNLVVAIVSGVINIVGNVVLINMLGSIGAAITTLVVVIVSSILSTAYYVKILKDRS